MKAISIRQPLVWTILHAGKDIENRSWNTRYRGDLLIHASGNLERDLSSLPKGVRVPNFQDLSQEAIVGVVQRVGVVERSRSKWFSGPYCRLSARQSPTVQQTDSLQWRT